MEFGKIISTGFKQAWKYKSLWILGFLLSGSSTISNIFNFIPDDSDWNFTKWNLDRFNLDFFTPLIILGLVAALLLLILVFIVLGTIAIGALIDAARCLKESEEYRLGKSFKAGLHYFWRLFGIMILSIAVVFAVVVVLGLAAVACFLIHVGLGILSLIIIIPLFILAMFIQVVTLALAERIVVIRDRGVFDAIGDAWNLWTDDLGNTLLYCLIYLGISIGVGLATLAILMAIAVPFVAIGFASLILALLLGIPVVLLISIIVQGFTGAAMHLMTTEFYYQLSGWKDQVVGDNGQTYSPPPPPSPPEMPDPIPPSHSLTDDNDDEKTLDMSPSPPPESPPETTDDPDDTDPDQPRKDRE